MKGNALSTYRQLGTVDTRYRGVATAQSFLQRDRHGGVEVVSLEGGSGAHKSKTGGGLCDAARVAICDDDRASERSHGMLHTFRVNLGCGFSSMTNCIVCGVSPYFWSPFCSVSRGWPDELRNRNGDNTRA